MLSIVQQLSERFTIFFDYCFVFKSRNVICITGFITANELVDDIHSLLNEIKLRLMQQHKPLGSVPCVVLSEMEFLVACSGKNLSLPKKIKILILHTPFYKCIHK